MKVEKVKKRDRERTKGKILKAVGDVIEQYGTEKVGVNLIARTAGVNKVLIYRYFESVDGLMEQYVKSGLYTSTSADDYLADMGPISPEEATEALTKVNITFLRDMRSRKATRDLLRWEIGTGKPMLTDTRNASALKIMEKIGKLPNYEDTGALMAFLTAGIYYLTISADYRDTFIDLNLKSDEDWKRIEDLCERLIRNVGK
ncbi:AcrR family transcriptional regulator [Dyadobacter jejuensis]|uniref:AcrR family transcriptional regulator n=1 Tax=Dyadobacter jejuensis TaxID=1082580 RepID=A0A316ASS0_9BACT|nr:TetR/AcrR family transcriptional regulator [Dyadobacter jejuensis]PWJ59870.1 AcrR family transcriptional regulator [Dyadobacter jejuensis]